MWRIDGSQHEHLMGWNDVVIHLPISIMPTQSVPLNHVDTRHAHATFRLRSILLLAKHVFHVGCRQVDGVTFLNMLRLNGCQHGINPACLTLPLVLDGCHAVHHLHHHRRMTLWFLAACRQQTQAYDHHDGTQLRRHSFVSFYA